MNTRQHMLICRLFGLHMTLVNIAIHLKIGAEAVCAHCTSRFDRCRNKSMQGSLSQIRNGSQSNTANPAAIFFDDHGDQCFALR